MNAASLIAVLGAYLIGSVSFAVVVSRLMGLADPRTYGSGNPGATNVLRTGNKRAALLTLLGDALKGAVAVLLVEAVSGSHPFAGKTALETMHRISCHAAADVPAMLTDCDAAFIAFFVDALHPDVARRPATAAEFGHRLIKLGSGAQ